MGEPRTAADCLRPYASDIARACIEYGVDPYVLAGLLLRETGCGWGRGYVVPEGQPRHLGWGDDPDGAGPVHARAFGLIQADVRWHAAFVYSAQSATALGQFRYACRLLRDGWRDFLHSASFNGHDADAWRCSIAAYNGGFGRVLHQYVIDGIASIDRATTGGDYSKDVLHRAEVLRGEHPGLFTTTTTSPPLAGETTTTGGTV